MRKLLNVAALFGSLGTLVCCVLPALFVFLGAGASFATLIGAFPQITVLSEHKGWVFGTAGLLLASAALVQWRASRRPCPVDPRLAEGCRTAKGYSAWVLTVALAAYAIGATFAFILPRLMA
jgi:hypothetical protein